VYNSGIILDKLKRAGFRITAPRKAVIEVLKKDHKPQSAQAISAKLAGVDLVSVYRTLDVLEEIGAAQREDVRGVATYYLADDQHHHITCRKCGQVECVPCEHTFRSVKGFHDVHHQLTMTGICNKCNS